MSHTYPQTTRDLHKEAENSVNRAVRHCRIGKVKWKPLFPPLRAEPPASPYGNDYDKPRGWGYDQQPLGPWDAPLVTWGPPPVISGVQVVEPRDTYAISGASHAH